MEEPDAVAICERGGLACKVVAIRRSFASLLNAFLTNLNRKENSMRLLVALLCAMALVSGLAVAEEAAPEPSPVTLEDENDRINYALGAQIGKQLANDDFAAEDLEAFFGAIEDAVLGRESAMSDEEIQQAMVAFQQKRSEKQQAAASGNLVEAQAFLEENGSKEGVQQTDSGLQYQILEAGDGEQPAATDEVKVHYKGTLMDGTVFDSSYERGEPVTFPLNQVIPGWTEGLQLIKEGGKAKLWIPPDLGYGPQGRRGAIPPNALLIFEVELLEITKSGGGGNEEEIVIQ